MGILVRSCNDVSDNPKLECASEEDIKSKVDSLVVDFVYRLNYFDPDDYGLKKPKGVVRS